MVQIWRSGQDSIGQDSIGQDDAHIPAIVYLDLALRWTREGNPASAMRETILYSDRYQYILPIHTKHATEPTRSGNHIS